MAKTTIESGAPLAPNTRYYVAVDAGAGSTIRVRSGDAIYLERSYDDATRDDLDFFETGDAVEGGTLEVETTGDITVEVTSEPKTASFESL